MSAEWEARCDECHGLVVSITDPPIEDRCRGGRYACEDCGKGFGIWLDGGVLDLGLIDADSLRQDSRFEIFAEPTV